MSIPLTRRWYIGGILSILWFGGAASADAGVMRHRHDDLQPPFYAGLPISQLKG